jgi:hypothetical protein
VKVDCSDANIHCFKFRYTLESWEADAQTVYRTSPVSESNKMHVNSDNVYRHANVRWSPRSDLEPISATFWMIIIPLANDKAWLDIGNGFRCMHICCTIILAPILPSGATVFGCILSCICEAA